MILTFGAVKCQLYIITVSGLLTNLFAEIVLVGKYRRRAINAEILTRWSQILKQTLNKWESELLELKVESDRVYLLIDYKPDLPLPKLIGNFKTVNTSNSDSLRSIYIFGRHSSPVTPCGLTGDEWLHI